eukprot:16436611-Heterocapsa_arctica.AAC.1
MDLPNPLPPTQEGPGPTQPSVGGSHGLQPASAFYPPGTPSGGQPSLKLASGPPRDPAPQRIPATMSSINTNNAPIMPSR